MTDSSETTQSASAGEPGLIHGDASTELSSNRTAMSFMRTQLSTDRTLMSIIRTALSLIGFGFTIYQFFGTLQKQLTPDRLPSEAPARFGVALIAMGVLLLIMGIFGHWREVTQLRARRTRLHSLGLVHSLPESRISPVAAIAIALLAAGILAIMRIAFGFGPF